MPAPALPNRQAALLADREQLAPTSRVCRPSRPPEPSCVGWAAKPQPQSEREAQGTAEAERAGLEKLIQIH